MTEEKFAKEQRRCYPIQKLSKEMIDDVISILARYNADRVIPTLVKQPG